MSTAAAVQQSQSHSGGDLALASVVGGGSQRAVEAANAILASFAEERGVASQRTQAVNDNQAKDTAAMFAMSFQAAGLNFANVDSGFKAPAAAPTTADVSNGVSGR